MYFTDRGIEELEKRRGDEDITFAWLAERLRTFVDLNPEFETPVERLAVWLARLDDEDPDDEYSCAGSGQPLVKTSLPTTSPTLSRSNAARASRRS